MQSTPVLKRIGLSLLVSCCALLFASCEGQENTPDAYSVQYTDTSVVFTVNGAMFTLIKVEGGTFAVRSRREDQLGQMNLDALVKKLQEDVDNKI